MSKRRRRDEELLTAEVIVLMEDCTRLYGQTDLPAVGIPIEMSVDSDCGLPPWLRERIVSDGALFGVIEDAGYSSDGEIWIAARVDGDFPINPQGLSPMQRVELALTGSLSSDWSAD